MPHQIGQLRQSLKFKYNEISQANGFYANKQEEKNDITIVQHGSYKWAPQITNTE